MHVSAHPVTTARTLGQLLLKQIGQTPLLRLPRIAREAPGVALLAKAEWLNPGGSVKDRPALRMVEQGEETGALTRDKIILDATSGNTGIAYAMIGAVKGYRVKLALPANVNRERLRILQAFGAELVLTSPLEGSDGAIREAQRIYRETPERYFFPDQYNNPENWRAHALTTGPEIWAQTHGQVTHLVAGLGTTGTLMGTGTFLKEANPAIQVIALTPDEPLHGLEGWKHMDSAIVPGIYDPTLPDRQLPVSTEAAYAMVKRLAREEGLLVSPSSGAALVGALQVARELNGGVVVTIFPDSGFKYLNESFWD